MKISQHLEKQQQHLIKSEKQHSIESDDTLWFEVIILSATHCPMKIKQA